MSRAEWRRRHKWLAGFLMAEAALVAVFVWCCVQFISYQPEPDVLTVIKEVPVEVTVPPEVQDVPDGPSEAAVALARTVWGEARGCSTTEQAAVVWCVLNRVSSSEFPNTVEAVCSQRTETIKQFDGYDPGNPVEPELLALAEDVLARWELEKKLEQIWGPREDAEHLSGERKQSGESEPSALARGEGYGASADDVGRVLPADYLFFEGDGRHNHFRKDYIKTGEIWGWSLPSPYKVNDAEGGREGPLGGED